jgi:lysophospholipase L1-like esterase
MSDPKPAPSRRRLFALAALLLPLLGAALLEGSLRAVGFGGPDALFVEVPDRPGYLRANPEVMRRYVESCRAPAARIPAFPFRAEKPEGGLRLVVQGASSAVGFPYGRWAGLAGMLADRLEAGRPDDRVEVVTTALAAVTSYTLEDLADEIVAIEPDAVLIYAGHNEYVGVLGAGSSLSPVGARAAVRLHVWLGRSRLYRLAQRAAACAREAVHALGEGDRQSLFARAARASRAPFGSRLYRAGLDQFETNVSSLLERYRRAGIPVYLATLVSNERDLPPFAGGPGPGVDRERWARQRDAAARARDAGDRRAARTAVEGLLALDGEAADAWFALGRLELDAGRSGRAREALRRARDLDALRFRAPSALNARVVALAARYGAHLVDVESRFVESSVAGIPGQDLLLEHVHPNADGYFLLADAFYEALLRDGVLGDRPGAPSREAARRDMPLTALDRVLAGYDVREMMAAYPFSDPPRPFALPEPTNAVERIAQDYRAGALSWIDAMERLMQLRRRQGRIRDAARVARLAANDLPLEPGPNRAAGLLLLEIGEPARARLYLERAWRADPDDARTRAALVRVAEALGDRTARPEAPWR